MGRRPEAHGMWDPVGDPGMGLLSPETLPEQVGASGPSSLGWEVPKGLQRAAQLQNHRRGGAGTQGPGRSPGGQLGWP